MLTDAQIERYLQVRRAAKGRTDLETAGALGIDAGEYAWIRSRVIESLVALDGRKIRGASEETYARTIAAMRRAREGARDRETQARLADQIAALERERADLKKESLPADVAGNARRVAPRREEIEALTP